MNNLFSMFNNKKKNKGENSSKDTVATINPNQENLLFTVGVKRSPAVAVVQPVVVRPPLAMTAAEQKREAARIRTQKSRHNKKKVAIPFVPTPKREKMSAEQRRINQLNVARTWKKNNKEKHRMGSKNWQQNNRGRDQQNRKRWRQKNKERHSIQIKSWKQNNQDRIKMKQKNWYQSNKNRLKSMRALLDNKPVYHSNRARRICRLNKNGMTDWLKLHPHSKFSRQGINFERYLATLSLNSLIYKYPQCVKESFLQNKNFLIYLISLFNWPGMETMSLQAVEERVKKELLNKNTDLLLLYYVGLYAKNGKKKLSNPYHPRNCSSSVNKRLVKGYRAFENGFISCNVGDLWTATGDKLREMVAESDALMRRVEGYLIHFGLAKNVVLRHLAEYTEMPQIMINKRREPVTTTDKKEGESLAAANVNLFSNGFAAGFVKSGGFVELERNFVLLREIVLPEGQ